MIDTHASHSQYIYGAAQVPVPSDYVTMPVSSVSPLTFYTPLVNVEPQHVASPQYHYTLPNFDQPGQTAMSRFLPSPPVKIEPLEPDDIHHIRHEYAVSYDSNNRYISSQAHRPPSYHGRLHLQGPSNQTTSAQQLPTFTSHNGHVSNMTPSERSYYNWQYRQQHAYQSSRSSLSSTMLDHNSSTDSVATMAPLDMKSSSPVSSLSGDNGSQALADVSITLHPWTTQAQSTNLSPGATYLSTMSSFGPVQGTAERYPSPPLASIHWSSDDNPILPIEPPVAALSLREIQCRSGTNWPDPLQHDSGSEHDVSDSEDDAYFSADDDALHETDHEPVEYDHDQVQKYAKKYAQPRPHLQQSDEVRFLSDVDDFEQLSDKHDTDHDPSDNEDDPAYAPCQAGNRPASLLDLPAVTSNLRSKPAANLPGPTKIHSEPPAFPIAVSQRAAAKLASKRLTALSRPSTPEIVAKSNAEQKVKPKDKANPPKKRVSYPRAPKKTSGKKRPLAVTSAAASRVPAPIVNFNIHKKSRGRAVTTDPNAVDSNIVHVCPVPACGACFKRREHVKRHIRGLHTEDKPYACRFPDCQSRFTRGDNLKGHYINKEPNPQVLLRYMTYVPTDKPTKPPEKQ